MLSLGGFGQLDTIPSGLSELDELRALSLDNTAIVEVAPLADLTGLDSLYLANTHVANIAPLAALTELRILDLRNTAASNFLALRSLTKLIKLSLAGTKFATPSLLADLSLEFLDLGGTPVSNAEQLSKITTLQTLDVGGTRIADLRPLLTLGNLGTDEYDVPKRGLNFKNCAATAADPKLDRLSRIEDYSERTQQTLAYLRTLPPYPEPLPWLPKPKPKYEPTTITALLEAQEPAGWRFSPDHGAMVLFVDDSPQDAQQDQLANMSRDRVQNLLDKLGERTNSGGLRQDVAEEAKRFLDILDDNSRSLSLRSLELWGSLVALGTHLDANDRGRLDGRDPLDLLSVEARSALQTLLSIAGNLVRSFPEARELDEGHTQFARKAITPDMVLALIDHALKTRFVEAKSAALIQHVAELSGQPGSQGEKADTVTKVGGLNLIRAAAVAGYSALAGVVGGTAAGITSDVGTDVSNHYELGERAIDFLEGREDLFQEFLIGLPPDEAANLESRIRDAIERSSGPR